MKSIAIMFSMILGLLFMADTVGAQQHRPKAPKMLPDSAKIVKMVDHLSYKLKLSDDQKNEVLNLHHLHFNEAKKNMEQVREQREKQREEMDAFRKDFEAKLLDVFDDDQKVLFKEFMEKRGRGKRKPVHKH